MMTFRVQLEGISYHITKILACLAAVVLGYCLKSKTFPIIGILLRSTIL